MRRWTALVVVVAVGAAACGNDGGDAGRDTGDRGSGRDGTTTTVTPTTSEPTTSAAGEGPAPDVASLDDVDIRLAQVAELESPTAMAVHPDADTLFFAQREGSVVAVSPGDGSGPGVVSEPIVDIADDVTTDVERGLLGLAFSPDGDRLYLSYSGPDGETLVDELAVTADGLPGADGFAVDAGSRRTVFELAQPFPNHNGVRSSSGRTGSCTWAWATGVRPTTRSEPARTATSYSDPSCASTRWPPTTATRSPATTPLTTGSPRSGPTGPATRGASRSTRRPATSGWPMWARTRSRRSTTFRPTTTGPVRAGAPTSAGTSARGRPSSRGPEPDDHVPPVFEYTHDDGNCSVTGGYVYQGSALPNLTAAYVFGDFCVGELRAIRLGDDGTVAEEREFDLGVDENDLVSFGQDADGELYVLTLSGRVLRLEHA